MTQEPAIRRAALAALAATTLTYAPALSAQDAQQMTDEVVVAEDTGAGATGRLAVNIAVGNNNQQAGDAVIAIGDIALVTETVSQRMSGPAPTDHATSITIGDGAFAGVNGLSSINITAGTQNQMANLAALAIGNSGAMSDQLLEQSRAPIEPNGGIPEGSLPSNDRIAIGDTAFGEGSGLIQVNLIGGEGNSSANTFALTTPGEGSP